MKFKDRKEKRKVNDILSDLLCPLYKENNSPTPKQSPPGLGGDNDFMMRFSYGIRQANPATRASTFLGHPAERCPADIL